MQIIFVNDIVHHLLMIRTFRMILWAFFKFNQCFDEIYDPMFQIFSEFTFISICGLSWRLFFNNRMSPFHSVLWVVSRYGKKVRKISLRNR